MLHLNVAENVIFKKKKKNDKNLKNTFNLINNLYYMINASGNIYEILSQTFKHDAKFYSLSLVSLIITNKKFN